MGMSTVTPEAQTFANHLRKLYTPEEIKKALAELRVSPKELHKYRDDPAGFGIDVLGEYYTPDIIKVMESVRDNRITIARSSNQIGKSHCAGRLALWFMLMWDDAQVYTASAPPEDNLKRILWGEIGALIGKRQDLISGFKIRTLHVERSPRSFLTGVAIPTTGTKEERQAKFCADASDLFELTDGSVVTYKSLIDRTIPIVSVDDGFNKVWTKGEFFDNGNEEVFEITLSTGEKIRRTGKHPLYIGRIKQVFSNLGGTHIKGRSLVQNEKWLFVNDIEVGNAVLVPDSTDFNFGSVEMNPDEIKVLAYLIGDGCTVSNKRVQFTQTDNKQLAEFKESVSALGGSVKGEIRPGYTWGVFVPVGKRPGKAGSNPILNLVRKHGLVGKRSATKFIPKQIFRSAKESIALFLNRLYSTDGWACMCKVGVKYEKAEIGYASKSEGLARDIQRLLYRFGICSLVRRRRVSWMHEGIEKNGYCWQCTISRSADIIRFSEEIGIYGKERSVGECVAYAKSRGAYASWQKCKHVGFRWERVKSIRSVGERSTVGVYVDDTHTYLTRVVEHNSGKHSPHLLFIIDEGDAVPDEVYAGIESCMSGGHVRLLIMFNPRRRSGTVWRMERDGEANVIELSAFNHPNVTYGEERVVGAVDRETTVRRINDWTRPLVEGERPSEKCFEVPSFLVGETAKSGRGMQYPPLAAGWREVIEPAFWYMVLGLYPQQDENQLISQEWIDNARARWDAYVAVNGMVPPQGIKPVLGLDVGEYGPDPNVACFRYGGWVAQFTVWNDMDTDAVADKALELYKEKGCRYAYVDATGYGSNVAPKMGRNGASSSSVKVGEGPTMKPEGMDADFLQLRDQLWWLCREWLRTDPGAMLPPDEMLIEELIAPTYSYHGTKRRLKVMSKDAMKDVLKRSPDRADSLCLTFAPTGGWSVGVAQIGR